MASITTIAASDVIADSRAVINTNFTNLNTDKIETSYLDTDTALTANSDSKIATQKAVKAYVDSGGQANASETVRGLVEEATDAEVTAGTATGGTGAKLIVTPAKLTTRMTTLLATVTPNVQIFTSSGTYTKPSGAKLIEITLIGGGGGGSKYQTGSSGGAGGGGGSINSTTKGASLVTPTVSVTIGAAGTGETGSAGTNGGDTTFGSYLTAGGGVKAVGGTGGAGGTASGGISGGTGGNGQVGGAYAGGGGGGAAGGNGGNGSGGVGGAGGTAGTTYSSLGAGGVGGASAVGGVGSNYGGGGGGGGDSSNGGNGAGGYAVITTYY